MLERPNVHSSPPHPLQWVPAVFLPRVKRPGREADISPPSSA
jgi:hypothetical protein